MMDQTYTLDMGKAEIIDRNGNFQAETGKIWNGIYFVPDIRNEYNRSNWLKWSDIVDFF